MVAENERIMGVGSVGVVDRGVQQPGAVKRSSAMAELVGEGPAYRAPADTARWRRFVRIEIAVMRAGNQDRSLRNPQRNVASEVKRAADIPARRQQYDSAAALRGRVNSRLYSAGVRVYPVALGPEIPDVANRARRRSQIQSVNRGQTQQAYQKGDGGYFDRKSGPDAHTR